MPRLPNPSSLSYPNKDFLYTTDFDREQITHVLTILSIFALLACLPYRPLCVSGDSELSTTPEKLIPNFRHIFRMKEGGPIRNEPIIGDLT
ncbi:MAG: hypothetical protein L7W43_13680 [Rubripirellula sp.]|nr:hypothetical protein [Rubripirellula sp.]